MKFVFLAGLATMCVLHSFLRLLPYTEATFAVTMLLCAFTVFIIPASSLALHQFAVTCCLLMLIWLATPHHSMYPIACWELRTSFDCPKPYV